MKKQTRATHFITILLLALVLAAGSGIRTDAADKPVSMFKGESYSLKKAGAAGYKSSDSSVVKVSSKGTIKGVKKGNAKITYKIGKKKYTKEVYVIETPFVQYKEKAVDGKTFTLKGRMRITQFASIRSGATATLSVSGDDVLTVKKINNNQWDLVVKDKTGTATVTVKCKATTGTKKASFKVNTEPYPTFDTQGEVKKVISSIIKPGMTDVEKVNAVALWMCENVDYFYIEKYPADDPKTKYYLKYCGSVRGALENHLVVCEGYAETFSVFMEELGIDNMVVIGSKINHAWNIVKMDDGEWYQVDITFADSASDKVDYGYILFVFDSTHEYIDMARKPRVENPDMVFTIYNAPPCGGTKYDKYFVNYFKQRNVPYADIKQRFGFDW